MARRRMTLRRIDPWSVLKFGAVVNACLFVIVLLGSAIVWFAIRQLGIIEQACGLATDVGFESCAVNGGNLFRYLLLLGLLWVVIQTGLFVFFAFLHNLIADLVGGIAVTMAEEGAAATTGTVRRTPRSDERTTGEQPVRPSGLGTPPPRPQEAGTGGAAAAGAAAGAAATGRSYGASTSSGGGSDDRSEDDSEGTPYERRVPSAPPASAPRRAERPSGPSTGGWPWDPEPGEQTPDRGSERGSGRGAGASQGGSSGGSPESEDREERDDDDQLFGHRDR